MEGFFSSQEWQYNHTAFFVRLFFLSNFRMQKRPKVLICSHTWSETAERESLTFTAGHIGSARQMASQRQKSGLHNRPEHFCLLSCCCFFFFFCPFIPPVKTCRCLGSKTTKGSDQSVKLLFFFFLLLHRFLIRFQDIPESRTFCLRPLQMRGHERRRRRPLSFLYQRVN